MAVPLRAHARVKNLAVEAGVLTGKESNVLQPEAHVHTTPGEAPKASDQAAISASLEWQRKLEAAEALLTLRDSSQAPSDSTSVNQPCVPPAPAGDKGLQPPSPSLRPRPASSVSLPIGHLGCISLLS
uniref:Doublesex- and mab-3-related transcription factor C1/C2 C-terminal domain-containing protein n=1 Tax=Propithecus coquereli TaxID=379532 RepID=A0A2K6ERU8_PROCO